MKARDESSSRKRFSITGWIFRTSGEVKLPEKEQVGIEWKLLIEKHVTSLRVAMYLFDALVRCPYAMPLCDIFVRCFRAMPLSDAFVQYLCANPLCDALVRCPVKNTLVIYPCAMPFHGNLLQRPCVVVFCVALSNGHMQLPYACELLSCGVLAWCPCARV